MSIIKLVTVMDNVAGEQKAMKVEHGLSFYIETEDIRILFDFGSGIHALENAKRLGIRLEKVDFAVGSHGHYDHAAGYPHFVREGLCCPLITGKGFFHEKYAKNGPKATYLGNGFDPAFLRENGITHSVCKDILPLSDHCWAVGGFPRTHPFETIPERFVLREGEDWIPDHFEDEICLVVEEKGELVVIVGCSHPGILNILNRVKQHFSQPIRAVAGGTHLVEADRDQIHMTLHAMKEMGIGLLAFNHCSGNLLREMMAENSELNTVYLGAGDCLFL